MLWCVHDADELRMTLRCVITVADEVLASVYRFVRGVYHGFKGVSQGRLEWL